MNNNEILSEILELNNQIEEFQKEINSLCIRAKLNVKDEYTESIDSYYEY